MDAKTQRGRGDRPLWRHRLSAAGLLRHRRSPPPECTPCRDARPLPEYKKEAARLLADLLNRAASLFD